MRYLPAEWAPQSAIQYTFPHENSDWAPILEQVVPCFVALIEATTRYQTALVVCHDKAKTAELLRGAVPERLILVELPSNDTWTRDHGGITVIEDGAPVVLDFMFNGWGLKFAADKDNLITGRLHELGYLKSKSIEKAGLVLEGGGIESDGQGTILTTAECLLSPNRNPHLSQKEIEDRLRVLLGADRFLWLHHGYLAGDDTDSHIDTLARFCNPTTIAYVQCTDSDDVHYAALKAMEAELQQFRQADGTPYELVALPMASACYDDEGQRLPATYANFLILNGAVFVPTYNVPEDAAALDILRGVFPNHTVLGFDCLPLIWQHGSLHCVTMQYPEGVV